MMKKNITPPIWVNWLQFQLLTRSSKTFFMGLYHSLFRSVSGSEVSLGLSERKNVVRGFRTEIAG